MKKIGIILLAVVVGLIIYAQLQLVELVDLLSLLDARTNNNPVMLLQEKPVDKANYRLHSYLPVGTTEIDCNIKKREMRELVR